MIVESHFLNHYNGLCSIALGYSFCLTSLSIFREGFSRRKEDEGEDSYALLGSDSKGIYKILIAKQHGYGSGDRARPLKFNLSRPEIKTEPRKPNPAIIHR